VADTKDLLKLLLIEEACSPLLDIRAMTWVLAGEFWNILL
jgi:hypothetical protein